MVYGKLPGNRAEAGVDTVRLIVGEEIEVSNVEVMFIIGEVICTGKGVTVPVEMKLNEVEV